MWNLTGQTDQAGQTGSCWLLAPSAACTWSGAGTRCSLCGWVKGGLVPQSPSAPTRFPGASPSLLRGSGVWEICQARINPAPGHPWQLTPAAQPSCLSNPVQVCCPRGRMEARSGKQSGWKQPYHRKKKKRAIPRGIRSPVHPTTPSRAVPGNCLDFPSEKQLAGSDPSSSGSQCCQCH